MTADPQQNVQSLARLCRDVGSARDRRDLFQRLATYVHDVTGCNRIGLLFLSHGQPPFPGSALDFSGPPRWIEVPVPAGGEAALRLLRQGRQAHTLRRDGAIASALPSELFDQHSHLLHCLPLVCRDELVGVLTMAARDEEQVARWDAGLVETVGALFALALDNGTAHARLAEMQRFQRETAYLRDEIRTERDLRMLTGESPAMKAVRLAIQQVARTDSTVLVLGETGTGKELVARAIHQLGPRRDRLLVTVNCAALAPGVIASELFGHEQGAFTGAIRRRLGRFELAHRGTIFLDEIGELPAETQVLLLRVLQERTIERVGGHEPIAVDVRVIAATHQDLEAAVAAGRFRADLFFRLNVFPIHVPPLRDRRGDIPDLVRHFVRHFGRRLSKPAVRVAPATLELLICYSWPGNVRELENIVERAMIVTSGDTLDVDPGWLKSARPEGTTAPPGLAEQERRAILAALDRSHGRIYGPGGAAELLGVKPTTLYGKMRKHQIPRKRTAE